VFNLSDAVRTGLTPRAFFSAAPPGHVGRPGSLCRAAPEMQQRTTTFPSLRGVKRRSNPDDRKNVGLRPSALSNLHLAMTWRLFVPHLQRLQAWQHGSYGFKAWWSCVGVKANRVGAPGRGWQFKESDLGGSLLCQGPLPGGLFFGPDAPVLFVL